MGGQTRERQLDGLRDVGAALSLAVGVPVESLWSLRNGHALCSAEGLPQINTLLTRAGPEALDHLRARLRVGVHRQADVTWGKRWTTGKPAPTMHSVTQVFCSALPVAYGEPPPALWAPLAALVLEAAYEATLWEAVTQSGLIGPKVLHLTMLGGGAFGNDEAWILGALRRALTLARDCPLEARLVGYDGRVSAGVTELVSAFG